jgi:hypothetical protein
MAVNVLGRAYIEVHADTKPFGRELQTGVESVTTFAEKRAKAKGSSTGKAFTAGFDDEARKGGDKVGSTFFRFFDKIITRRSRDNHTFSDVVEDAAKGVAHAAESAGMAASSAFSTAFSSGLSNVGSGFNNILKSIGSSVGNVGSNGPFASIIGLGVVLGVPALIGAVIALINVLGPLLNVVGLIPGAFSLAAAAIIPLVVAFHGFGDAIGAILEGDPEKIAQALAALAPAAKMVAEDFQRMLPWFKEVQKGAQNSFFAQLLGILPKVQAALKPIIGAGFNKVAIAGGGFFAQLLLLAKDPQIKRFLSDVFDLAARTINVLGPPILSLITALTAIADASFPTLEALIIGFASLIQDFADFLQESVADGSFDAFLSNFMKALGSLNELIHSGLNLIDAILGGEDEKASAEDFFAKLIHTIDATAAFFRSPVGREALQGMIDLARIFLLVLLGITGALGLMLALLEKIVDVMRWILVHTGIITNVQIQPGFLKALPGASAGTASFGGAPGHAEGGIFNSEHLARVAEGGRSEVIIPLTDRRRAMELADRSGLSSMMNQNDVSVNVYIGDEQINARIDKRVGAGINGLTRSMQYGPRPTGVGG